MQTADLLDIDSLVSGWHRPEPVEFVARELDDESALEAIDVVCSRWPMARWVTDGECGRVVVGPDDFLSERFSLLDELAEHRAWFQAAGW